MAVYIKAAKLIFTHMPKTGGTWVTKVLAGIYGGHSVIGPKHHPINELGQPIPEGTTSWAVLRSPYDWLLSYWRYQEGSQGGVWKNHKNGITDCLWQCRANTFPKFIESYLRDYAGYTSRLYSKFAAATYTTPYEALRPSLAWIIGQIDPKRRTRAAELSRSPRANVSKGPKFPYDSDIDLRLAEAEPLAYSLWHRALTRWSANFSLPE